MPNNFLDGLEQPQSTQKSQQNFDQIAQQQNEVIKRASESVAKQQRFGSTGMVQPDSFAADTRDIFMSGAEKTKRSLVAGTGDVMEQVIDLTQLAYNYATPLGMAEQALGLDFSKNIFDWVEENTAGQLQEYGVKYRKPGTEDFKWSDLGTADFWTTDFARQMPNLLTMMAGGMGLAKGAGNLMTKMASKSLAKKSGKLSTDMLTKTSAGSQFGGKGLGKLFTKGPKGVALTNQGKAVAGLGGGAGMNIVDGAIVSGMAYDRALDEFGTDEQGRRLAGQIAGNIFIDNSKWMAVDAVSWSFTFGGGSKLLLPKAVQKMNQSKSTFGKRVNNILINSGAGATAGASIAGAATLGEEGMGDSMLKGAAVGLGAGLLPGRSGARASALVAPEGIEEMFQETYQEWIEKKAFNEARGEEEKTPTYWDFYSSDEARRTKAVALISGMTGATISGYTNLINDVAERSFQNDQRIDSITRSMNRLNIDETYEKSDAIREAVREAVKYDNQESLKSWLNEEAAKDNGSVDERFRDEMMSLIDNMTSIKEKIGTNVDFTASEERVLFEEHSLMAMREDDYNNQKSIYESNLAELQADIDKINKSRQTDKNKKNAIKNINTLIEVENEKFAQLENNYNALQNESQSNINDFTTKALEKAKNRNKVNKESFVSLVNKAAAKSKSIAKKFVASFNEMKTAYAESTSQSKQQQVLDEQGNPVLDEQGKPVMEQAPEDMSDNRYNTFVDNIVKEIKIGAENELEGFTDEEIKSIAINALTKAGITNETSLNNLPDDFDVKLEEIVDNEIKLLTEEKKKNQPSLFEKIKTKTKEVVDSVRDKITTKEEKTDVLEKEELSVEDVLNEIINSTDPDAGFFKGLAKKLLTKANSSVFQKLVKNQKLKVPGSTLIFPEGLILINPKQISKLAKDQNKSYNYTLYEVVLHEQIHRLTMPIINAEKYFNGEGLTNQDKQFLSETKELYNQYLESNEVENFPRVDSYEEFITYGLTNSEFMTALNNIQTKNTTVLNKLIDAVIKSLNLKGSIADSLRASFFVYANFNFKTSESILKERKEKLKEVKEKTPKKKADNKDLRIVKKLENQIAKLELKENLTDSEQKILNKTKKALESILLRIERSKLDEKKEIVDPKKTLKDKKKKAKKKNEYKTAWYNPMRILEKRKLKAKRDKEIKLAQDEYQEYVKKNKPSYIYAMRDAKTPQQSIQIASDISSLFGQGTLGSVVGGVIYGKVNPDLYNTIKHEFGHVLWPALEGLPIKDSLIKLIVEDKTAFKKVAQMYPENILFDTSEGPMLIEEMLSNVEMIKQLLNHDITLEADIKALQDKMSSGQIYSAEVNLIIDKIKSLQSIVPAAIENQEVIQEEIFAQMLEMDDVTLENIITSDVKTTKSYKRKTKIALEKLEAITKKSNEEQDKEILKSLDDEYRKAQGEGINTFLEIFKAQSEKRRKKTSIEKASRRVMRQKSKGFVRDINIISEIAANLNRQVSDAVAENTQRYNVLLEESVKELQAINNPTQEQISEILEAKALEFTVYDESELSNINIGEDFEKAIAGKLLGDITILGVFGDSIITEKLKEADIINEKSQRIPFAFEEELDQYIESNDNPLVQNERSSASKLIEAFAQFAYSRTGRAKIATKEQFAEFTKKSPSLLRQNLRRELHKSIKHNGDIVSFNEFLQNLKDSKSLEVKLFNEFIELEFFELTQAPYGSEQFFTSVARSIYHEASSNVVENRDILFYQEEDSRFDFVFNLSELESFYSEALINENVFYDTNEFVNELDNNSTIHDAIKFLKRKGVINDNIYKSYIDENAIMNTKSIVVDGKMMSIKDAVKYYPANKAALLKQLASSSIIASRDLNQTTLVEMAKLNTRTSLLNKTSALYENFDSILKYLQDPTRPTNDKIKTLANSSVFSLLLKKGITPIISATSGAEVTKEDGYKFGSSYVNMTSEEMFISDVLRYISQDESYQMPIMVFEGKSRRYNVTVPKYKSLHKKDGAFDEVFVIKSLAKEISEARYKNGKGNKVSKLFKKPGSGKTIIEQITDKKVLDEYVNQLEEQIKTHPYILKNLIESGKIKSDTKKLPRKLLEEMVVSNALNKYSAQKSLVADHAERKDAIDYVKRSAMAIARRRPIFDELEVIVTPDIYYNPNAEPGLQYINEPKEGYSIVDDSQSWILPEDKKLADENAGLGNEYGSVLKTVYSGKDTRSQSLDSGDLYLKHNTVVISDAIVEEAIKAGNVTLAKLRAVMRSRKNHIAGNFSKNVPVIAMSQSSVKSDINNPFVKTLNVDDVRVNMSDIVNTFNDSKYNALELELLLTENVSTDLINVGREKPIKQISLEEFNKTMDDKYVVDGLYRGLDGKKFGIQNILESKRNEESSTVPIQLLSNILQALPEDMKSVGLEVTQLYTEAVALSQQEVLDSIEKELSEYIDPKWAGNPLSYLVQSGNVNLPSVQSKLMEVISKSVILGSTKFRSPGGIAFETSPVGIPLASRVKTKTLKSAYGLGTEIFIMPDNLTVSEIILPAAMSKNFKKGDIVTATRVPADKLAMTQTFVIKEFLDEDAGQVTMIPPAVSAILGSDKDGDSLFIDGKYAEPKTDSQKAYNRFHNKLTDFLSDPNMDEITSKSLEGIENFLNIKDPRLSTDILSPIFDKQSAQNNVDIRNILGVAIIALRDTNYLSFYNASLLGSVTLENSTENKFEDSVNGAEVEFVSKLVNLILDNAKYQRVFSLGINSLVIKDAIILSRLGFDYETVLEFLNKEEVVRMYKYSNRANILKSVDPKHGHYEPAFLSWLEGKKNMDAYEYINDNDPKNIESLKQEYYGSVKPLHKTDAYRKKKALSKLDQKLVAEKGSLFNLLSKDTPKSTEVNLSIIRMLSDVKNDISSFSDILNVYNTNPQSVLEIKARQENYEKFKNFPLGLVLPESLQNDPILNNRLNALVALEEKYESTNSFSNKSINKLYEAFSKIFNFDKGYKSKSMSMYVENTIIDKALSNVINTNATEFMLDDILNKLKDVQQTKLDIDSMFFLLVNISEDSMFINQDIVSRATDQESLAEMREMLLEELKDITIDVQSSATSPMQTMSVYEALATYEYNKTNKMNEKSRLRFSDNMLALFDPKFVKSINNALSIENVTKLSKFNRESLLDLAEQNTSSVVRFYQSEITDNINDNTIYLKDNKLTIPYSKFTSSNRNLINALFTAVNRPDGTIAEYTLDNDKIKGLLDLGVDAMPLIIEDELHYIDLKTIGTDPKNSIKKKTNLIEPDTNVDESARLILENQQKNISQGKVMRRKTISDSSLLSYNSRMTLEDYAMARNVDVSLLSNDSVNAELKKQHNKMSRSKDYISSFLKNIYPNLNNYSKDQLMRLATDISSEYEIEELAKQAIVKEISIVLAQKARDEQIALNPEGYEKYDEKDVSFLKKWLMSNDVDTNNPDVQAMTRIIEKEYFLFTQEYNKEARPIKEIAKKLKSKARKDLGLVEYLRLWTLGKLNAHVYRNIYQTVKEGENKYVVLKKDTTGLSNLEKQFHAEFTRVMEIHQSNYKGEIPYQAINMNESFSKQGLYGLYLSSEGMESHLNSVPVYAVNPMTGNREQKTFVEWKELYSNKDVNKNNFKNLQNFRSIKSKAIELAKKGIDEDGRQIAFDQSYIKMLLGTQETSGHINMKNINLKEFASLDLESIALKTLRSNMFKYGTKNIGGKFEGFDKLGVLIDGIIEYNDINPNIKEWVETIYKGYIKKGKMPQGKLGKYGKALDAFVLFTTLKVLGPWNIMIPISNIAIGKYQQLRATGMKQFLKGESRFINPANYKKNAAIIRNFVGFDLSMYESFYTMKEKTPFDQIADLIMLPMEQSEKYIQGAGFLSYLSKEEYDNITTDENGHVKYIDETKALSPERIAELMENVRREQGKGYNITNQRLTGMYATSRLLFQFKKYIPTLVTERFGKDRLDRFGRNVIGSNTAVAKLFTSYLKGETKLSDLDKQPEHIKYGIRKLRNGIFFSLAIAAMAGWDEEDDWMDKLSKDTRLLYDTSKYKYRLTPSAYWNMKSIIN